MTVDDDLPHCPRCGGGVACGDIPECVSCGQTDPYAGVVGDA